MKFKYYLRGLGIGILFATIILAISYHKNNQSAMSDSDIISAAKKLGMDFVDSTEGVESTQGIETTQGQETQGQETQSQETQSQETQSQETESQETESQETQVQETESQETESGSSTEEIKTAKITVTNDISWRMVFNSLEDAGIIKDGNELYEYYNDKYSDVYLQNGTFEIPSGASYDEIIKILSTKP